MGGILALISVAACAFTAVTYYRCEKQPEPQFSENELLHILAVGSAADGVGYEVMRIVGGSVNPPARPALENRFRQDDCRLCGDTVNGKFFAAFRREQHPNQRRRIISRLRWFCKDTTKSWRQSLPPAKALQHYNYISYLHDSQWFLRQMGPFRSDA